MPDWLTFLIVVALVVVAGSWIRRLRRGGAPGDGAEGQDSPASQPGGRDGAGDPDPAPGGSGGESVDPLALAAPLVDHFDASAHPRDILEHDPFLSAAESLMRSDRPNRELLAYANGANEAESRDRIEVGFQTAGSLLRRIGGGERQRFSPPLVRRLAERLYLLGVAVDDLAQRRPQEAFLRVQARHDPGSDAELEDAFARRIARMYMRWSDKRGMRRTVLDERDRGEEGPYEITLGIDGFGAHTILAPEMGLHVLEVPDGNRFRRARALVLLAQQGAAPAGVGTTGLLKEARTRVPRAGRGRSPNRGAQIPGRAVASGPGRHP